MKIYVKKNESDNITRSSITLCSQDGHTALVRLVGLSLLIRGMVATAIHTLKKQFNVSCIFFLNIMIFSKDPQLSTGKDSLKNGWIDG